MALQTSVNKANHQLESGEEEGKDNMASNTSPSKWIRGGIVKEVSERFFYWWGRTLAANPYKVILAVILLSGLATLSLLKFRSESSSWKLWLPDESRHWNIQKWKEEHFVENMRATITLFAHEENVLTSEALLLLLDLHKKVRGVKFEGRDYSHACMRVPITNIGLADRRKKRHVVNKRQANSETTASNETRKDEDYDYDYTNFYGDGEGIIEEGEGNDTIDDLPREIYCDIVETLEDKCGEYSILEIWKYDEAVIANLTNQDIIDAIYNVRESPIFGYETNFTNYLGQVQYNSSGHAVAAKSVRSMWLEQFDPDNIPPTSKILGFDLDKVDPFTMGYEAEVIKLMKEWRAERTEDGKGYVLYMNTGRSYTDEASGPIEFDVKRTIYGYTLMFLYTMLTLGKLNRVEHKFYLAAVGIFSCLCGSVIGIGFSLLFGFTYTALSGLIPFICLGIGIDDMFVIIRCFNNIPERERKANGLVDNFGITMRHAGVSITITSLTDIFAFGIGALASFPALQSFCISAAVGILSVFLFQSTWVVAWMVVDQRRIEQKRDGFLPFIIHEDWEPPKWTHRDIGGTVMTEVAKLLELRMLQALVILLTIAMVACGIWGARNTAVVFDIRSLLPEGSYLMDWIDRNEVDFPVDGFGFGVDFYTEDLEYSLESFEKLEVVVGELDNLTREHGEWVHYGKDLPKSVSTRWERASGFWWLDLKKHLSQHKGIKDWREAFSGGVFRKYLSDFLHHRDGSAYNYNFRFDGEVSCNVDAPPIKAVKLGTLKLRDLVGPTEHVPAQVAIRNITGRANFTHQTFAYSPIYAPWEVEEILAAELLPNLSLALLCVMIVVFVTLADLYVCLLILSCVLFTMIDVVGVIYMLGLTIDPFSLASIIIGIGLSVDYSVHIAHAFIISEGTRMERTRSAFVTISPAVLHGGVTTFLSLVFLATSESYCFITFFKIMSAIVLFGLFHGLVFLPNMLSLSCGGNVDERNNLEKDPPLSSISKNGIDNPDFKPANI